MDYWDYLGWPDRFGNPAFTKRQRVIASFNRSRTIYTPQVVLQGKDFRNHSQVEQHVTRINQTQPRADITLQVTPQATGLDVIAEAKMPPEIARQAAVMFVALYENSLKTDVKAGENAGHALRHDYVVRRWIGPTAPTAEGTIRWADKIPIKKEWNRQNMGVVVCVLNLRDGDVLQTVALPLSQNH